MILISQLRELIEDWRSEADEPGYSRTADFYTGWREGVLQACADLGTLCDEAERSQTPP